MVATKSGSNSVVKRLGISTDGSVFIRSNNVLNKVRYSEISWIHADGNYCYVHANDRKYAVKVSLKRLLEKLQGADFVRVHKSYVVQLPFIQRIDLNNSTIFIEGQDIPVGRAYKSDLIDYLEIL